LSNSQHARLIVPFHGYESLARVRAVARDSSCVWRLGLKAMKTSSDTGCASELLGCIWNAKRRCIPYHYVEHLSLLIYSPSHRIAPFIERRIIIEYAMPKPPNTPFQAAIADNSDSSYVA